MKKVDSTLAVVTDEKVWYNSDDIPVDAEFMELFSVTHKTQRRTEKAVMMFLTLGSTLAINTIKFHPTAWAIISNKNVFVHPDKFNRPNIACPGYLIHIHPRLVWKDYLLHELRKTLEKFQVNVQDKVFQR